MSGKLNIFCLCDLDFFSSVRLYSFALYFYKLCQGKLNSRSFRKLRLLCKKESWQRCFIHYKHHIIIRSSQKHFFPKLPKIQNQLLYAMIIDFNRDKRKIRHSSMEQLKEKSVEVE